MIKTCAIYGLREIRRLSECNFRSGRTLPKHFEFRVSYDFKNVQLEGGMVHENRCCAGGFVRYTLWENQVLQINPLRREAFGEWIPNTCNSVSSNGVIRSNRLLRGKEPTRYEYAFMDTNRPVYFNADVWRLRVMRFFIGETTSEGSKVSLH